MFTTIYTITFHTNIDRYWMIFVFQFSYQITILSWIIFIFYCFFLCSKPSFDLFLALPFSLWLVSKGEHWISSLWNLALLVSFCTPPSHRKQINLHEISAFISCTDPLSHFGFFPESILISKRLLLFSILPYNLDEF